MLLRSTSSLASHSPCRNTHTHTHTHTHSANSVYGFTGATVGQLPCIPIASSVTSYGRELLFQTKAFVEKHYTIENGFPADAEVVYGDTDSVMVKFGVPTVVEAMPLAEKVHTHIHAHTHSQISYTHTHFPIIHLIVYPHTHSHTYTHTHTNTHTGCRRSDQDLSPAHQA